MYLTEDNFAFPSGFYRYIPPANPTVAGHLVDGGQLQMLKVVGVNQAHLEAGQINGATYPVEWVDIDEPYPARQRRRALRDVDQQRRGTELRRQPGTGARRGALLAPRGGRLHAREVYFTATQGGGAAETGPELITGYGNGRGQVWSYSPRTSTLTCRFQSPGVDVLDFPDNVAARNDRGTVVLCEDGTGDNFLRGLSRDAVLFDIALNRLLRNNPPHAARASGRSSPARRSVPTKGPCSSTSRPPKGSRTPIWGPWGRIGV